MALLVNDGPQTNPSIMLVTALKNCPDTLECLDKVIQILFQRGNWCMRMFCHVKLF